MASSSCSTTITVLPRSRSRLSVASRRCVVALVQADRGLIEDVHHPGQARADLARQANALRLAAGERAGAAIEPQIVQAHVDQEAQPLTDLAHDACGDLGAPALELQAGEVVARLSDRQARDRGQVAAVDQHRARGLVQSRTAAVDAGTRAQVFAQFLAHRLRVGLAIAPLEVGYDALERVALAAVAAARLRGSETRSAPRRCRTAAGAARSRPARSRASPRRNGSGAASDFSIWK